MRKVNGAVAILKTAAIRWPPPLAQGYRPAARNETDGGCDMKGGRLGNSGLKVSVVGLGCNNFGMRIDQAQTQAVVDAAIDAGITLFDTADVYGGTKSEEF